MKRELKVFKCEDCGTVVIQMENEDKMDCCNKCMIELVPNSVDASFEKHIPSYEIIEGKVIAKVNHVMEEDHYIEWIAYVTEDKEQIRYFEPYMEANTEFEYVKDSKLYAYCNKHGLWEKEVE